LKTRLLGAFILIALAVIFVPMFFSGSPPAPSGEQNVSLDIPPAPDRDLKTQTMSLTPPANAPAGSASASSNTTVQQPVVAPGASSDRLPTLNIGSSRPRDVETDPQAGRAPEPTTLSQSGATSAQPVIPAPAGKPANAPAIKPPQTQANPAATSVDTSGVAARGSYTLNLSAYSPAGAQKLIAKVRALGYPADSHPVNRAGQTLAMVSAGPFETRAAAETARLKIGQSVSGVHPQLESGAVDQAGDAPTTTAAPAAPGKTAARAGGFAVQVAAMGSQTDAEALRDKLRNNGFDGYVDHVDVGGKRLWRVRAGPQTQRADAERLRDQIKTRLGLAGNIVTVP
jgi:cell division septation protein DedD